MQVAAPSGKVKIIIPNEPRCEHPATRIALLLALLAAEGVTVPSVRQLISPHVFLLASGVALLFAGRSWLYVS